jgi:MYXO-CTERM domain-containing protein
MGSIESQRTREVVLATHINSAYMGQQQSALRYWACATKDTPPLPWRLVLLVVLVAVREARRRRC